MAAKACDIMIAAKCTQILKTRIISPPTLKTFWSIMNIYFWWARVTFSWNSPDANNVSNFGVDPVTQLNFKKTFNSIIYAVLRTYSIAVTRSQFLRLLLRDHAHTAAVWKTIPA